MPKLVFLDNDGTERVGFDPMPAIDAAVKAVEPCAVIVYRALMQQGQRGQNCDEPCRGKFCRQCGKEDAI